MTGICKQGMVHVRPVGTRRECRKGDKCVNRGRGHTVSVNTGQGGGQLQVCTHGGEPRQSMRARPGGTVLVLTWKTAQRIFTVVPAVC